METKVTENIWYEVDELGDTLTCFATDENFTCLDFIDKTEQPIDRLRRICKVEGVSMRDDFSVIKVCREYIDGNELIAAYHEWCKQRWTQAAVDSGLLDYPCDGTN